MSRLDVIRKTGGYKYRNGTRTVEEFKNIFGIDPTQHPDLWRITGSGLVIQLEQHDKEYDAFLHQVTRNWQAIGIKNGYFSATP